MATSTANDPLYYDVSPEFERYTKFFLIVSTVACFTSIICAVVKAQDEKKFYIIIISLAISLIFVICIYTFFKRRILLAEKLWFVNLTIFILFLQALIYLIFVFIKPYPLPPVTTTTIRTTPHTTTPHNSTNRTNTTTTTTTRSTTRQFGWNKKVILTKLYELDDIDDT